MHGDTFPRVATVSAVSNTSCLFRLLRGMAHRSGHRYGTRPRRIDAAPAICFPGGRLGSRVARTELRRRPFRYNHTWAQSILGMVA